MSQSDEVLDLDYDSPLESLFGFMGSPWSMGGTSLMTWFVFIMPGKNGAPPIWADFPVVPFFLFMLCLWGLGQWLQANYDVRYQLDSKTQQLNLVRKIFGQTFRSKVAEFSQLLGTGITSTWTDDKQGNRSWQYALCLITRSARVIRVSSFGATAPGGEAALVARNLSIEHFRCKDQAGILHATRDREGKVTLGYTTPENTRRISGLFIFLIVVIVLFVVILGTWLVLGK